MRAVWGAVPGAETGSDAEQVVQPRAHVRQQTAAQGVTEALDGGEGSSCVQDEQSALWRDDLDDGAGACVTSRRTLLA